MPVFLFYVHHSLTHVIAEKEATKGTWSPSKLKKEMAKAKADGKFEYSQNLPPAAIKVLEEAANSPGTFESYAAIFFAWLERTGLGPVLGCTHMLYTFACALYSRVVLSLHCSSSHQDAKLEGPRRAVQHRWQFAVRTPRRYCRPMPEFACEGMQGEGNQEGYLPCERG
jgi:hypothetical protein